MRLSRPGFTIVELLVVVAIIVVLMSLLAPALDRAVDAAEIARCAANLHAWGGAHGQYFLDSRRKLLSAPNHRNFGDHGVLPNHARVRHTTGAEAGDFNLDDIAPYVQGSTRGPRGWVDHLSKVWYCPSSADKFLPTHNDNLARDTDPAAPPVLVPFLYNDYAYFGHIGRRYTSHATRPAELNAGGLESGRVLMADVIFYYPAANRWSFNHSAVGYSRHEPPASAHSGEPPLTGTNRLSADGAVIWKDGAQFNPRDMYQVAAAESWVSSGTDGQGPNPGAFINFY